MFGEKYKKWRKERKRNSCPESRGVGNAIAFMFGVFALGVTAVVGAGKYVLGGSDKANAEGLLKNKNYTIDSYEGKAGWFSREGYYSDKFNVTAPNGTKNTVIISRDLFSDVQNIGYIQRN